MTKTLSLTYKVFKKVHTLLRVKYISQCNFLFQKIFINLTGFLCLAKSHLKLKSEY